MAPVPVSTATTEGSETTMPSPRRNTSVFAVPRSIAMSRPPRRGSMRRRIDDRAGPSAEPPFEWPLRVKRLTKHPTLAKIGRQQGIHHQIPAAFGPAAVCAHQAFALEAGSLRKARGGLVTGVHQQ